MGISLRGVLVLLVLATASVALGVGSSSSTTQQQQKRVLALVDDLGIEKSHSLFLKFLRDNGFTVDIKDAGESGLRLHRYGDLLYDHLLLFAPKKTRFGGDITVENIVKFIDMGGNVLAAAAIGTTSETLKTLALECGFELDDSGTAVIDHFHYDTKTDDGPHTLIAVDVNNLHIQTKEVVGPTPHTAPFLYRGIALRVDETNPLAFGILHASSKAYSYKPGKQITTYPFSIGRSTVLLGSMQARNNARVSFVGSLEFFSDAFFQSAVNSAQGEKSTKSGNEPLAQSIALWTLKQTGVLKIVQVEHFLVANSSGSGVIPAPSEYTVMEDVKYRVQIQEFQPKNGQWIPYQGDDVQLEFVRIDPFVRIKLKPEGKLYLSTQFKVPDVYGVFTFKIDYKRQGLTYLESRVQIPVRPLLHTQYERFIYSAYPYYASAFSMMLGVMLMSVIFIGLREDNNNNTNPSFASTPAAKQRIDTTTTTSSNASATLNSNAGATYSLGSSASSTSAAKRQD